MKINLKSIQEAGVELRKFLKPSPLILNPWLSDSFGAEIYLKLENMQPIGSFKIRGATYKISCLTPEERKRGVIAASAGNHAQGVAWGSRRQGVNSLIVMPIFAPIVKIENTKALGAEVILKGNNYDEAFAYAKEVSEKTGRVFIHAFEDEKIIAGQGTVGLEMIEQLPDADYVFGSIGGGGLMAGISTAYKALSPQTKLIGCQAARAASMSDSIRKGIAVRLDSADTFADGIAIKQASEVMRKVLEKSIDGWVEVDEDSIVSAVLQLLEKAKILAEGAGAVPLAAVEYLKKKIYKKKVIVVISGGNIDVNVLGRIIEIGLVRAGRRVRINVVISDRPGSLAQLTDLIAKQGANIIQAIHDRDEPSSKLDRTEVELTLETSGPDHSAKVMEALKSVVLRLEQTH